MMIETAGGEVDRDGAKEDGTKEDGAKESAGTQPAETDKSRRRLGWYLDSAAVFVYVATAFVIIGRMWLDPAGRSLRDNRQDQVFFEWVLAHAAKVVSTGGNPIFTDLLNAPRGVNLMANTSILGLAVPLSPITLWLGSPVSFTILLTLALAGTAISWYFLLSRHIVRVRLAAFTGAAFCGFAPAMISQDTGHPNIASQFVVPLIVLAVMRMREPGHSVRKGLVLAALVVYQAFINEEMLLFTALAIGVFLLAYWAFQRGTGLAHVRAGLPALGVTALAAGAVLAVPLWHQFFGPQHYRGLPAQVGNFTADLASYPGFSRESWAGDAGMSSPLVQNASEENSFFGWPLLLMIAAVVLHLRRDALVRAVTTTGLVFFALSLGAEIRLNGEKTGIPGPWRLFGELPLFDSVVPTRLALVVTPVVGVLLAVLLDRVALVDGFGWLRREKRGKLRPSARLLWSAAIIAAMVPIAPTPLPTEPRPTIPKFFTTGSYRQHLPENATVLSVPPNFTGWLDSMQWSSTSGLDFKLVGGYFLAPDPVRPDRQATFGPGYNPTLQLLVYVARQRAPVEIDQWQRQQARADIRYWKATTLILPAFHSTANALRETVDKLVGPGRQVDDVWLWDVRNLPDQ